MVFQAYAKLDKGSTLPPILMSVRTVQKANTVIMELPIITPQMGTLQMPWMCSQFHVLLAISVQTRKIPASQSAETANSHSLRPPLAPTRTGLTPLILEERLVDPTNMRILMISFSVLQQA
jgi:hypothetical protein